MSAAWVVRVAVARGAPLERGADAGGPRDFLCGRAVHCGDALELLLPGGTWRRVRYETRRAPGGGSIAVLYMPIGHAWEERFEVVPDEPRTPICRCVYPSFGAGDDPPVRALNACRADGTCPTCGLLMPRPVRERVAFRLAERPRWRLLDRRRGVTVTTDELVDDDDGGRRPAYPDLEHDVWTLHASAVEAAADLTRQLAPPPTVHFDVPSRALLRWPDRSPR